MESELGRLPEALALHEEALRVRQAIAEAEPDKPQYRYEVAVGWVDVGTLQSTLGKRAEALASLRRGRTILEELFGAAPSDLLRHALANAEFQTGNVLRDLGHPADAVAAYERAVAFREELLRTHPYVFERSELARALSALGRAHGDAQNPEAEGRARSDTRTTV